MTMTRTPFVLRSPNGPNSGKYYAGVKGVAQIIWTSELDIAKRLSIQDSAGIIYAAIDMACEVLVPESIGATEEEIKELAAGLAKGMFQSPSDVTISIVESSIRRSADATFYELPESMLTPHTNGYMSVWKWLLKASYKC